MAVTSRWLLLLFIALAACVGPSRDRPRPNPNASAQAQPPRDVRQCLASLARSEVRFERLPDRWFGGGCSATGAVKLLDVGTPTANLGAMRCELAQAFAGWSKDVLQPEARRWLGAEVVRLESMGTYACRPVNGQAGGKLSEHGRANAIDVAAFVLAGGRRVSVKADWTGGDPQAQGFLRAIHRGACRRFGVVLGPDANRWHHDHLHFDMGSGPYCR